jgi:hypothetical protein
MGNAAIHDIKIIASVIAIRSIVRVTLNWVFHGPPPSMPQGQARLEANRQVKPGQGADRSLHGPPDAIAFGPGASSSLFNISIRL